MIPLATFLLLLAQPLSQRVALPQADRASATTPFTVVGRATNAGKPLIEVGIVVELRLGDEVLRSVDRLTDRDGSFAASLPQPGAERYADDPWLRRRLRVRVRADEPGFMRYVWDEPIPTGSNVVALRELRWSPGGTLTLHVLDQDGAPVPSSEVELERFMSPPLAPPETGPRRRSAGPCGALPRNAQRRILQPRANALDVHFTASEHGYLLLRSSGRGTAYLADVTMPSGYGDDERTVRLQGSGRLSGTLHDPDGNPLADVALTAVPIELVDRAAPERRLREIRAERETAGGLVTGTCTTDAAGRFDLGGLQPGTYFMIRAGGDETVGTIPRHAIATGSDVSLVCTEDR